MQREQISFLDTAARDAAWARLHADTLTEQNLPPEALFHPDVIAQHPQSSVLAITIMRVLGK